MKNLIASTLSILLSAGILSALPVARAASPHAAPGSGSVSSNTPSLGLFETLCFNDGSATADSRNISIGSHHVQVAHLQSQNTSESAFSIQNLNSTTLKQGIHFTLVYGSGDYLVVTVDYLTHDIIPGTTSFVTPNSKVPGISPRLLYNGSQYYIPARNLPANVKLTAVHFVQFAQPQSCDFQTSDINNVLLNSKAVPIDTSAPSSSCVKSCGAAE